MRREHVLVLVEGLPYPFDVRVRAQVQALAAAGYRVTVAGPTGYGCEAPAETLDGVRVLRYRAPPGGRGALGYLREYATACLRLTRLARRVAREDSVDLVLVCNPPDSLMAIAVSIARRGAGILLDYREISPELFEAKFGRRGPLYRLLLACERYAFRHCDAVITVSEPCAEIARTRGGVAPERIFHVGNGPDPGRIFAVAPRPELRRGREHLVLWLGAMSSQEGLERLIDVAEHVVRERDRRDVSFAIVGPGDAHEELRREVLRRGLEEFVLVSGPVEADLVRAYLSTADVCVGVDVRNAMNDRAAMRKVLEYMAAGRPVVQFPLLEMRRICGDATLYARDGDTVDFAALVCALLDDPWLRERLGEAARERAHRGLMWPQQVPALLEAVATTIHGRAEVRAARPIAKPDLPPV
jgi:glycosyltransferase involved in cell wall biosynthesis